MSSVLDSDELGLDDAVTRAAKGGLLERLADKYTLGPELARGPRGVVVHAATNRWTGRRVVIERLAGGSAPEEARVLVRARAAARLVHPSLVEVLDLGTDDDGAAFVVREHLEGPSLADWIAGHGPLSLARSLPLFSSLADALALAHEEGIVHGHVTSQSIRIVASAPAIAAKLVGLGIGEPATTGALGHTAPEVLRGARADARADVFSLAACMHEAITGAPPFAAPTVTELLRAMEEGPAPVPSARALGVGPAVDAVLASALRPDPVARTASMRSLLADLVGLREEARATVPPTEGHDDDPSDTFRAPRPAPVPVEAPLRLGVVWTAPGIDLPLVERALEDAVMRPVRMLRFRGYAQLVDAFLERDVELGWLPPAAYVRARRNRGVRLLFATVRGEGPTYRAALLGRRGVVDRLADVPGKRAAWVDGWSAAGYLVPRAMLSAVGISVDTQLDAQGFLGGHDEVVRAIEHGAADLGATHCQTDPTGGVQGPFATATNVGVVAVSEPIPGDTLCASPLFADDEAEALSLLLLRARRAIAPLIAARDLVPGDPCAYDALERSLLATA